MKRVEIIIIFLVCLVSFLLLSIGIDKPFNGHHDFNSRLFSQIGRNYLKYGHLNLRLGQLVWDHKPTDPGEIYYTHHPPTLPIILSASLQILGDSARSVRLVPITFSVLTLAVFYLFVRRFLGVGPSVLGIAAWVISPMFLYFGKMANYEPLALFFIVFALWQYAKWQELGDRRHFRLVMLGLFLGQWTFWPAYYLAGLLFVLSRRWELIALSLVNFFLFIANVLWITGSPSGGGLWEVFLFRVGLGSLGNVAEAYRPGEFVIQELRWSYHFFTPAVFLTTLVFFSYSIQKWIRNRRIDLLGQIWLIFFLTALVHVVLFQTGAWRHDFWLYFFLPFFALGFAGATKALLERFSRKKALVYLALAVVLALSFYRSQPFFWALQRMVIAE